MNSKWTSICLALLVVGLSGCATMSSEECANSDWSAVGYEDGARGYTSDRFGNHRKACAKHGITADFQAYQDGRDQGLVEFCQPGRAFNIGESGGQYHGVCAADLEPGFLEAYHIGYQLYSLRSDVNNAASRRYAKERELDNIEKDMRASEAALISADTSTEERILLLADIKEMSERTGQVEAEIQGLIADQAHYETELHQYEQSVAAYGY